MAISQESLNNFKQSVGNFDLSSLNASYDVSRTDGSIFNFFGGTTISAKNLVGITPELVTDFGTALDTYKSNITTYLNLMEAKEATVGFKGEAVNSAIKNFVSRIIEISKEYLDSLEQVEKEMIAAVQASYSSQDTAVGSSVTSDATYVEENKYNNVGGDV